MEFFRILRLWAPLRTRVRMEILLSNQIEICFQFYIQEAGERCSDAWLCVALHVTFRYFSEYSFVTRLLQRRAR